MSMDEQTSAIQGTALEDAHEAIEADDGRLEVKYPFAFKNLDWDEYHRYRPRYPESLLKMWLDYHQEHDGKFSCAHDVAAGPGTLAIRLAAHFDRMVVSDPGQANIASAKSNLTSASNDASKFVFIHAPAESVYTSLEPSSVDFISVGMAFHYFDAPRAIQSLAAMLKPGGTLAAVTYGFNLRFPSHPHLSQLWHAATSKEALRLIRAGALFPAALRGLASAMTGLDAVPLPTDLFEEGAQRVLVNVEEEDRPDKSWLPLGFVDEDPCWQVAPSRVGDSDVRRRIWDEGWRREADIGWLKGFLQSSQMGFGEGTWACDEWRALEDEVRTAGGSVIVEWPVSVVMAMRNSVPCQMD